MSARKTSTIRRSTRPAARPRPVARLGRFTAALAARAAALCGRHPGVAGGGAVFGTLFAVICSNALFGQPGPHPQPLLATRTVGGWPAGEPAAAGNNGALMPVPLVREVQVELARTGHYGAAIDGKPGRATEAAIRAFQGERGLAVDGMSSPTLLSQIRQATVAEDAAPEAAQYASLAERMGQTTTDETAAVPAAGAQALDEAELVRRIQSGLTQAQVAELTADGIAGERTRTAIRTFEALEGLDVTGVPDRRILDRLIAIGAAQ